MNRIASFNFLRLSEYLIIIAAVVVTDQVLKLWVFSNMIPGSAGEISIIGDLFKLHFIQNPGMAFGIKWSNEYGKLTLSILRLGITVALIIYFLRCIRVGESGLLLISLSLIIGGALGNGIDSTFYGILLDNAPPASPMKFLHGKVIDMFYLDVWKGRVSESIPLLGGKYLALWPIFNIADAAVSVGVVFILIFQRRLFGNPDSDDDPTSIVSQATDPAGQSESI
jgi:signal peptidase II